MTVKGENSKNSTKSLLELISELSKVSEYKFVIIPKSIEFYMLATNK